MQQTERISARLRDASSLPETLDVSFDAFEVIRLLARQSQDRDPGCFATFMRTADAAVDGREAITIAPSLPPPSRGAAEVDALAAHPDLAKVTASVASLGALLDGLLTHAATAATTPGDRAACEQATSAARRIHQLMVRSDDDPRLW